MHPADSLTPPYCNCAGDALFTAGGARDRRTLNLRTEGLTRKPREEQVVVPVYAGRYIRKRHRLTDRLMAVLPVAGVLQAVNTQYRGLRMPGRHNYAPCMRS